MGNEMGNNNVSGLQEQEKIDVEPTHKPLQSVEDLMEKHEDLKKSEEPLVVESDTNLEKQESDIKDTDKNELTSVIREEPDELSETSLVSNDANSVSEKNSSVTSEHQVQTEITSAEEEDLMKTYLDTKLSNQQVAGSIDSVCIDTEPSIEVKNKLQENSEGGLGSIEACVADTKEHILNEVYDTNQALPKKEMGYQESNNDEDITGTLDEIDVGKSVSLLSDAEEGDEENVVGLNSFRNDSNQSGMKTISMTEDITLDENINIVENGIEIEDKDFIHKTFPLSNGSVEEPKVEKMDSCEHEFMKANDVHEEMKVSEDVDASLSSEVKEESQRDDTNVSENGYQVDISGEKLSLIREENDLDLEKEQENFFEISTSSIGFKASNTNLEEEELPASDSIKQKIGAEILDNVKDHEEEQRGIMKLDLSQNQTDSEFLTIETPTQLEAFHVTTDHSLVSESARNLSTFLNDTNRVNMEAKDNDSSYTKTSEEELITKIDLQEKDSSFHVQNPNPISQGTQNQDSKENPLLDQAVSIEDTENLESLIKVESNKEHLKINNVVTKVSVCNNLLSLDEAKENESLDDRNEQTPLLNQKNSSYNDISGRSPFPGTEFEELETGEKSVEKQVIALERTSTEKLKAPLLSFMKKENHFVESPVKKQESVVIVDEDMNNTSPLEKEKRKPKYSIFSNCLCCNTVMQ